MQRSSRARASVLAREVVGKHRRDTASELLAAGDVQELVRAMCIRTGAEQSGNQELGRGKLLAQHTHERDRPTFTHQHRRGLEIGLAGIHLSPFQPGRERGSLPAGPPLLGFEADVGTIGRIFFEDFLEGCGGGIDIGGGRDPQAEFDRGARSQDVPGAGQRRHPADSGHRERRPPGPVEHLLRAVGDDGFHSRQERVLLPGKFTEHVRGKFGLGDALVGYRRLEGLADDLAAVGVLDTGKQLAQDPERGGHDPAGITGVHSLAQHLDREVTGDHAAQVRGAPELLVVATATVETHDQAWPADTVLEVIDVVGQIEAAALLAGLDEYDAAGKGNLLFLQGPDRGQRCVGGEIGRASCRERV